MNSKLALKYFKEEIELKVFLSEYQGFSTTKGGWFIGFERDGIVVKESLFTYKTKELAERALLSGFPIDTSPFEEVQDSRVPNFRAILT